MVNIYFVQLSITDIPTLETILIMPAMILFDNASHDFINDFINDFLKRESFTPGQI